MTQSIHLSAFPKGTSSFLENQVSSTTYCHIYLNTNSLFSFIQQNGIETLNKPYTAPDLKDAGVQNQLTNLIEYCSYTPAILSYNFYPNFTRNVFTETADNNPMEEKNKDEEKSKKRELPICSRTVVYLLFDSSIKEGDVLIEDWFFDIAGISRSETVELYLPKISTESLAQGKFDFFKNVSQSNPSTSFLFSNINIDGSTKSRNQKEEEVGDEAYVNFILCYVRKINNEQRISLPAASLSFDKKTLRYIVTRRFMYSRIFHDSYVACKYRGNTLIFQIEIVDIRNEKINKEKEHYLDKKKYVSLKVIQPTTKIQIEIESDPPFWTLKKEPTGKPDSIIIMQGQRQVNKEVIKSSEVYNGILKQLVSFSCYLKSSNIDTQTSSFIKDSANIMDKKTSLLLYGVKGVGKTFLLNKVLNHLSTASSFNGRKGSKETMLDERAVDLDCFTMDALPLLSLLHQLRQSMQKNSEDEQKEEEEDKILDTFLQVVYDNATYRTITTNDSNPYLGNDSEKVTDPSNQQRQDKKLDNQERNQLIIIENMEKLFLDRNLDNENFLWGNDNSYSFSDHLGVDTNFMEEQNYIKIGKRGIVLYFLHQLIFAGKKYNSNNVSMKADKGQYILPLKKGGQIFILFTLRIDATILPSVVKHSFLSLFDDSYEYSLPKVEERQSLFISTLYQLENDLLREENIKLKVVKESSSLSSTSFPSTELSINDCSEELALYTGGKSRGDIISTISEYILLELHRSKKHTRKLETLEISLSNLLSQLQITSKEKLSSHNQNPIRKLQSNETILSKEPQSSSNSLSWISFGGYEKVKYRLSQLLLWPREFKSSFMKLKISTIPGLLLYGPSGCGKSFLAQIIAREIGANWIAVKGTDIISKYVGESEENLRNVFRRAREMSPCIIFFDELDQFLCSRGNNNESSSGSGDLGGLYGRLLSTFLNEMDGISTTKKKKIADEESTSDTEDIVSFGKSYEEKSDILILGATSFKENIDPAMLRPGRLEVALFLGYPDPKLDYEEILKIGCSGFQLESDFTFKILTEWIGEKQNALNQDGLYRKWSSSDLILLCKKAIFQLIQENIEEKCLDNFVLGYRHFEKAFHGGNFM